MKGKWDRNELLIFFLKPDPELKESATHRFYKKNGKKICMIFYKIIQEATWKQLNKGHEVLASYICADKNINSRYLILLMILCNIDTKNDKNTIQYLMYNTLESILLRHENEESASR